MRFHAKSTSYISFTTSCCTDNKKISMFRYIFASSELVNQIFVKLAPGSIIDIHDIDFRLIESGIISQLF